MNLLQIYEPGQTPLPHANATAVGIDLGTTHSVAAIASEEGVEVVHGAGVNGVWFRDFPLKVPNCCVRALR